LNQAGLLTYSRFCRLPENSVAKYDATFTEHTAAGTVTELHRFPFYPDKEFQPDTCFECKDSLFFLRIASFFVFLQKIMGRILAIDYGSKRVGLAVTDPLNMFAQSLDTVPVHEVLLYLQKYCAKESVERFIVGRALQMNGEESNSMQYIHAFVKTLSKQFPEIPVTFVDERFTSVLAQKTMIDAGLKKKDRQVKATVDKIAATIILQTYLESNR